MRRLKVIIMTQDSDVDTSKTWHVHTSYDVKTSESTLEDVANLMDALSVTIERYLWEL